MQTCVCLLVCLCSSFYMCKKLLPNQQQSISLVCIKIASANKILNGIMVRCCTHAYSYSNPDQTAAPVAVLNNGGVVSGKQKLYACPIIVFVCSIPLFIPYACHHHQHHHHHHQHHRLRCHPCTTSSLAYVYIHTSFMMRFARLCSFAKTV